MSIREPFSSNWPIVQAIFGTSGDEAETAVNILTKTTSDAEIYCVLHDCYKIPEATHINLNICLPAKRPGRGNNTLCVLPIIIPTQEAIKFLFHGETLHAKNLTPIINYKAAKQIYNPILELIMHGRTKGKELQDFFSKMLWYKTKIVDTIRKMCKISPSPQWLLSMFGTNEFQFVLVSSCYFFQSTQCTVDTLGHLAWLFNNNHSQSLVTVNTLQDLGMIYCTSSILVDVPNFVSYIEKKLNIDDMELAHLDNAIDTLRGELVLPDRELVQFIYLAFHACLNNEQFIKYSLNTKYNVLIHPNNTTPWLTQNLTGQFKQEMVNYYNKQSYLQHYITVMKLPLLLPAGYTNVHASNKIKYWAGQSHDVTSLIKMLCDQYCYLMVSHDLHGLLKLATLPPNSKGNPKEVIFPSVYKMPVYRCQFLNKNYFILISEDNINTVWEKMVMLPIEHNWEYWPDTKITLGITYQEAYFCKETIEEQLQLSRHEYFNVHLPVFNLVLDLDLPIERSQYSIDELYQLCLKLREIILDVLEIFGSVNKNTHEVYFYKSSCLVDKEAYDYEGFEKPEFCNCDKKIGYRIITAMPQKTAFIGAECIIDTVKIINHIIKMDKDLNIMFPLLRHCDAPFDIGIYHSGRCIRLPLTYKIDEGLKPIKLLKIFVCHPHVKCKKSYVENMLKIENLTFHSTPQKHSNEYQCIVNVHDTNYGFLEKRNKEILPTAIQDIEAEFYSKNMDLITWFKNNAWLKLHNNIQSYFPEDRTQQFNNVSFQLTAGNIILLKPKRGSCFQCVVFRHRTKTQSVRFFIVLHAYQTSTIMLTLMSQCFASKCNNNKSCAHFTVTVPLLSTPDI